MFTNQDKFIRERDIRQKCRDIESIRFEIKFLEGYYPTTEEDVEILCKLKNDLANSISELKKMKLLNQKYEKLFLW